MWRIPYDYCKSTGHYDTCGTVKSSKLDSASYCLIWASRSSSWNGHAINGRVATRKTNTNTRLTRLTKPSRGGIFVVCGVYDSTALCRKSHVENVAVEGVATTQRNAISILRPTQAHNKIIIKAGRQEAEDIRAAHAHTCDPTCVMHPRAHGLSWGRQPVC